MASRALRGPEGRSSTFTLGGAFREFFRNPLQSCHSSHSRHRASAPVVSSRRTTSPPRHTDSYLFGSPAAALSAPVAGVIEYCDDTGAPIEVRSRKASCHLPRITIDAGPRPSGHRRWIRRCQRPRNRADFQDIDCIGAGAQNVYVVPIRIHDQRSRSDVRSRQVEGRSCHFHQTPIRRLRAIRRRLVWPAVADRVRVHPAVQAASHVNESVARIHGYAPPAARRCETMVPATAVMDSSKHPSLYSPRIQTPGSLDCRPHTDIAMSEDSVPPSSTPSSALH